MEKEKKKKLTSNKKIKTETGAVKKTTPTKAKKEKKEITIGDDDNTATNSYDVVDPKHPKFKPLTSFRIGMQRSAPPNPGSKIIPEGTK
ncbi:hypothetical protein M1146_05960 [Patescibacteria group bacterium]|nr:hypothetical protein [Patescibacteria group bacterium]